VPIATIRLGMRVLGADVAPGFFPTGIVATANDGGSDTLTFSMRRSAAIPEGEFSPFQPVELEVGGVLVWSGYIWETPVSGSRITVSCRGWQYHLDDDQDIRFFVHTRLGDYVDQRGWGTLANYLALPTVTSDPQGGILLAFPKGLVIAGDTRVGVTLDLGYAGSKRISVDWQSSNNDVNSGFFARTHALPSELGSGASFADAFSFLLNTGASGTTSGTFATSYRYVTLFLFRSAAGTLAADVTLRITGARNYAQTAYESGGQSILKASDVVKAMLYLAPVLDQSTALIQSTSFSIPELGDLGKPATARRYIDAANAFQDWILQVMPDKKVVYKPQPTGATIEVGAWGGSTFQDAALASGEEIYNWVGVVGTQPDGTPLLEWRNLYSPLLNRQGRTRTFLLNVSAAITTAAADAIGDAWLSTRARTPLRGTLTVVGADGARTIQGAPVEPYEMLLHAGDGVRLSDRVDPDTGLPGRTGIMQTVSYDHSNGVASVTVDSPRDRLDALLARLGVVETAAGLS
jgi:hypothetical protein